MNFWQQALPLVLFVIAIFGIKLFSNRSGNKHPRMPQKPVYKILSYDQILTIHEIVYRTLMTEKKVGLTPRQIDAFSHTLTFDDKGLTQRGILAIRQHRGVVVLPTEGTINAFVIFHVDTQTMTYYRNINTMSDGVKLTMPKVVHTLLKTTTHP